MKKQSFGIILAAVLGAGSLFSAVIPGTDALFTTALPGTGAVTVQAEASNSFGGSGSEEDDSYRDFAASEFSLVLDEADLLTDEEESQLLDKLEAITGEYNLEVAVATVESKDGNEMNYFTDHFFDENGYGTGENHDGILFMVSIGDREWHITTHGYGMTAFNDDGLAYLKENVEPLLKDENFYGAFDTYADLCRDLLEMAANGGALYRALFSHMDSHFPGNRSCACVSVHHGHESPAEKRTDTGQRSGLCAPGKYGTDKIKRYFPVSHSYQNSETEG